MATIGEQPPTSTATYGIVINVQIHHRQDPGHRGGLAVAQAAYIDSTTINLSIGIDLPCITDRNRPIHAGDLEPDPTVGRAFAIRFADDAALVFEREEDARRVLAVLAKRFAKYGLCLHPEKTRLVDFRSPPRAGGGGSQCERSFGLLGFTHYWGRSRKGRWVVQRKTAKDRFTRALREVGRWCRAHRHWPVAAQQAALRRKLQGHYAYYGITGNGRALARFLYEVRRLWRKWLNRRSWHARMTWEKFVRLATCYPLPQPRVVHSIYRRAATP